MNVSYRDRQEILSGKRCPYCGNRTSFINSEQIYGKPMGWLYACLPCEAWVGVHEGTAKALGFVAKEPLRKLRIEAKRWFNPLWMAYKQRHRVSNSIARKNAYTWLARQLQIELQDCHVGMFNETMCERTIEICKRHYKK